MAAGTRSSRVTAAWGSMIDQPRKGVGRLWSGFAGRPGPHHRPVRSGLERARTPPATSRSYQPSRMTSLLGDSSKSVRGCRSAVAWQWPAERARLPGPGQYARPWVARPLGFLSWRVFCPSFIRRSIPSMALRNASSAATGRVSSCQEYSVPGTKTCTEFKRHV